MLFSGIAGAEMLIGFGGGRGQNQRHRNCEHNGDRRLLQ